MDHGLDRLPFFMIALLLFFSLTASATTFGPISVEQQVANAQYIVHGKILGSSWVEEERESKRPYTHWKLQVMDQSKGDPLGAEVTIRQPGGELGGMGYRVAGTATFRDGEEVFVNLADTDLPAVKEVMALASGKYTVEKEDSGKTVLRSGLGFVLNNSRGEPYSPEEYRELVKRFVVGEASPTDKTIFVNKQMVHDHSAEMSAEPKAPKKEPLLVSHAPKTEDSSLYESNKTTEEPKGSSGWIFLWSGIVLALLALIWRILR